MQKPLVDKSLIIESLLATELREAFPRLPLRLTNWFRTAQSEIEQV